MAEGRFVAARRLPQGQDLAQGPVDLSPGDRVEIVSGRYRGSRGVLEAVESVTTPSGREVLVARFARPRAGVSYEFPGCMRRIEG